MLIFIMQFLFAFCAAPLLNAMPKEMIKLELVALKRAVIFYLISVCFLHACLCGDLLMTYSMITVFFLLTPNGYFNRGVSAISL